MATDTTVTDSFRESTISNLDSLGERRRALEGELARIEEEHRTLLADEIKRVHDLNRASLIAALAPIEAAMQDCNSTIYATERMLGALPAQAPRFQERDNSADGGESTEAPETEDVGRGLSESQAAG